MQNYLFNINHNLKSDPSSEQYTRTTFTLLFTFHDYFPINVPHLSLNKVQNIFQSFFNNNAE
jgi:hypothetical protein